MPQAPRLMARQAGLPCPSCEGMLTTVVNAIPGIGRPLYCDCGAAMRVRETREDPDHPLDAAVWRLRLCDQGHDVATVQFRTQAALEGPGARQHRCNDCGATFTSLERLVAPGEAQERLAYLARERVMLARAGRPRFGHPARRQVAS